MFRNRSDAGEQLAQRLAHLKAERPVVLGLPRGGVEVAARVAEALDAPLDVLVVRKLGAPGQPELAIGAVTDGATPQKILNDRLLRTLRVDEDYLDAEVRRQLQEVSRRQSLYRGGRPATPLEGRTVTVVDDGIATGATVRAGLEALRRRSVRRLVLAVPVAPPETAGALRGEVDELVCLQTPGGFTAVGAHYADFSQTTDQQVNELLEAAARRASPSGPVRP